MKKEERESRREFIKKAAAGTASLLFSNIYLRCSKPSRKPNIIYILADDLGYGELGCYGQKMILTPYIDRMAREGIRFTQHYSGSSVCAPSRCTLLTGKHTGHSYIRDNDEMAERGDVWHDPKLEGQRPLPAGTETIGTMLKEAGYTTCCIGKWGLGGPDSEGHPNNQGFDHFFGYLCQRHAHNYYPTHLWRNKEKIILENEYLFPHQRLPEDLDPYDPKSYKKYTGNQYAPDLMIREALDFIRSNSNKPFFLYYATPVPHVSLQIPEEYRRMYEGRFPEVPYRGEKGYVPNRFPRATYAAMITHMDYHIGLVIYLLTKMGLHRDTLIMFSSDNGPTFAGGVDYEFFDSNGPLRGLKQDLYEGGIRVPMIAWWPGHVVSGAVTDHISALWDVMPTIAELTGAKPPQDIDGISFLPTIMGRGRQKKHRYLYWEYFGQPSQAVRMGRWKGIQFYNRDRSKRPFELYDLDRDIAESKNIASENPEIVARIRKIMDSRTPSEFKKWNF